LAVAAVADIADATIDADVIAANAMDHNPARGWNDVRFTT